MAKPQATHAFVGSLPCGHALFLAVDEGRLPPAADIKATLARGGSVKRLSIEEARRIPLCFNKEEHTHG